MFLGKKKSALVPWLEKVQYKIKNFLSFSLEWDKPQGKYTDTGDGMSKVLLQ